MNSFYADWRGALTQKGANEHWLLTGRMFFGARDAPWLEPFSGVGRELVLVASTIRQVDRLVRRSRSAADTCWGRELTLSLPVSSPTRWGRASGELAELLHWLTDDVWTLEFVRNSDAPAVQQNLFDERPVPKAKAIALFSGGLDSVAGADVWLGRTEPTYLFSVSGDNVHAKHARAAGELIERRHAGRTSLLAATHQLRKAQVFERSQRTRGFFFFSLAAAAAEALGLRRLVTFEAGVGAMNLPMNAAQTEAENTRAMHPRTLLLLKSFFSRLFDSEFSVEAPFLFMTKGEPCKAVPGSLSQLARAAYSCDEPQARKPNPFEHCGFCTSCLFRRSALFAAMGRRDPTAYRESPSESRHAYEREAFRDQAIRFTAWKTAREVLSYSPDVRYALRFARQSPEHRDATEEDLVRLFNQHGAEAISMLSQPNSSKPPHRSRHNQESIHAVG